VLIQSILCNILTGYFITISDKLIRNVQTRIYSLHMNLLKHQLYLKEESVKQVNIGRH